MTSAARCCGVAADPAKDQTYMLAALSPESLARMRFPLGELTKPEVRELAARAGLSVAGKADSQDLCFLAGTSRARFLARHGGLDRPARRDRRRARRAPRPPRRAAPLHGRAAARNRGRGRRSAVRPRQGRRDQPRDRGAAVLAAERARHDPRRPSAQAGRPGQPSQAALPHQGGRGANRWPRHAGRPTPGSPSSSSSRSTGRRRVSSRA